MSAEPINLDAPGMTDLRHTLDPGRYTCPACGEAVLRRDPNDLCPSKVALRLATKDAEVDRLTTDNARLSGLVEEYRVWTGELSPKPV